MSCSVVGSIDCKAPGYSVEHDLPRSRASCFSCGEEVCTDEGCSKVIRYYNYGRRRICYNCQETREIGDFAPEVSA